MEVQGSPIVSRLWRARWEVRSNIDKLNDYLRLLAADNAALAADNAAVVQPVLAAIEDVRTAESEEEVEEPVSNSIDNDTLEDGSEKEEGS